MRTIRGRLLAMLLTGLALVLTAGGAAVYLIAERSFVSQFDAGLGTQVQTLASLVSFEPGELTFDSQGAVVPAGELVFDSEDAAAMLGDTFFEIRTISGELLKRSDNLGGASLLRPGLPEEELVFDDVQLPGNVAGRAAWFAFWPRVDDEDDDDGDEGAEGGSSSGAVLKAPEMIVAAAALDRGSIDRALGTLLSALVVVGAILALTVGVLVTVGIRWGLAPLNRLGRQLGSVDGRAFSTRIDGAGAPRELAPVYRELNGMLDRVERTLARERLFADAAAHELRTPLAELRAAAEVALRWPDLERASASLNEALAIGREMEHLVESLLLISRGNAAGVNGSLDVAAVDSIVHRRLEHERGEIDDKRLRVSVNLDAQNNALSAPHDAVEIIIRNLIDNAVQYTPPGGSIAIRMERAGDGAHSLIVENGPVELTEDDLPRLFEPFWRTDDARSDRTHVGLGLTVVQQIAHAVGLMVDASLADGRLRIRVSRAPITQVAG